ncbi:MAG: apolipoprotein N-acyltransferase [Pseudomonadota bacterium]
MGSIHARFDSFLTQAQARPGLCAVFLGVVAACGYPPLHGWWIALPALGLFIAQLHKASNWRAAAWQGWLFGWAHLTLANNWIATAFTHQAKMPEFLGWLAVPLLCVYLAIYPALAAMVAYLLARRSGVLAYGAVLAGAWIVTEWLRSWVFTGYPWPPLGLMLLGDWGASGWGRLLPWLGTYALSGVTLLLATSLLGAFVTAQASYSRRGIALVGTAAIIGLPMILTTRSSTETDIRYALIQPLLTQDEINDAAKFEEQFGRIADLSLPGREESRLVLWPESAIPDYLEDGYPRRYYATTAATNPEFARRRIGSVIGDQSTLLTGVVNLDIGEREDGILGAISARNSVLGLNGEGEITAHYAKAHLVPYGEYLPMRPILEPLGLSRLVAGTIDYKPGPGPRTLHLGEHGRAGIQICYEIVFSGQVVDRDNRPDYIFNPSNDGWFGWWGPPQHLGQARMRAIEEGLPVLRSTTTGVSAVIDADGIVRGSIPTGEAGRLDGFVPEAKASTLFARFGNALPLAWAALLILTGIGLPRALALVRARR